MTHRPIGLDAYEELAESYAALIETKPHNAFYERPATLSLLPSVTGKRVLDAGCGPGVYSEWLVNHGAEVLAIDVSPKMVALARKRTRDTVDVRVANLEAPLDFIESASLDLVLAPLVLDYIRDWRAVFREFNRVLVPGGQIVASVTHPTYDFTYFKSQSYFDTELVSTEWRGFGRPVRVHSYRRSLQEVLNPFGECGLLIERVVEPLPTDEFKATDARHYHELMRQPCFLCVRAMKKQLEP